ncbi:MAG: hypothetical protein BRC45_05755 [Cyanobacteria bacterium QS_5_48_63]|nr:MAG: hypothetical protein BRC45_05755 [Cyanobacteria bacterium QS_5_48_63]
MTKNSWSERARYGFDEIVSKGSLTLMGWLAAIVGLVVLIISVATWAVASSQPTLADQIWSFLITTLISWDPTAGQPWLTRASMLILILVNLFTVSVLVSVIVTELERRLNKLRRGRSVVLETDHTAILGESCQVFMILGELVRARKNQPQSTIVVLGDKDKVEMEREIRDRLGKTGRTRIICRQGKPTDQGFVNTKSAILPI